MATMTTERAPTTDYLEQFSAIKPTLPGAALAWLGGARQDAIDRFRGTGFPTTKVEAWKFTSLTPLLRTTFTQTAASPEATLTRADLDRFRLTPDCHLMVFQNGHFRPELSEVDRLPEGTRVTGLPNAGEEDLRALTAPPEVETDARARALFNLNTAFMANGAVVQIGPGAMLAPVQLLFIGMPDGDTSAFHLRNLIRAAAGSSATVLESYVGIGDAAYWTNVVTRVTVASNAVLRHYRHQAEVPSAFHIGATSVHLEQNASYHMFSATQGAKLARNEIDIDLGAPNAEARLSGVTLARDTQHLDTTVRVEHSKPRCASLQEFRSVVDDNAHSVFQGRVRVAPNAQKTDARQISRNLLLASSAAADAKPELEILADDVKCSHGATIGDLDNEALFYLRARGLTEAEARSALVDGFVSASLESIDAEAPRSYFRRNIEEWLREGPRS
jgi:Fe-S cluster assembly protein SufD